MVGGSRIYFLNGVDLKSVFLVDKALLLCIYQKPFLATRTPGCSYVDHPDVMPNYIRML